MKTSKRILCMLLAVVMTLSMGTVALAETTTPTIPASRFSFDNGSSATVYLGTTKSIAYTVQPSDYDGGITWSSSVPTVATVDNSGKVEPVKAGTTVITAKVTGKSGELSASCNVTVAADAVSKFEFTDDDDTYYIAVGENATVSTKATYLSESEDTTPDNVNFYIEETSVATVDSDGKVTAKAPGSTFLHAEYYYDGKVVKTASAEIVVTGGEVSVTVDQAESLEGTAKYELGINESTHFTATVEPDSFDSRLLWTTSAKDTIATIDNNGNFSAKAAASNITVTAYVDLNDNKAFDNGEPSGTIPVKIVKKPIESIKLSNATLSISSEKRLTPVVSPSSASLDDYDLVWSSSDETVATVSDGLVKAKASGSTTIMLQLLDKETKNVAFVATCVITVQNATYNTSVDAKVGTNKSLGLASTIASQFKSKTGCTSNPTTIAINDISGTNATLLYTSSSSSAGAAAEKTYTYSEFGSLYLRPKTTGTYYVDYTATNGNYKMTGTITIKVSSNTKNIYIELDSGDEDYVFTSDKNSDDTPAYEIIADTIGSTFSYIMFGDIDGWYDEEVGTLYASSSSSARDVEDDGKEYLNKSSGTYTIRKLCFSPNGDEGTFAIEYTAYNSYDEAVATGTLFIIVGEGADDGVTVTLDNADDTYYFDEDTEEEDDNAYDMLYDYIEDEYYKDYDSDTEDLYIKFYEFVEADPGVLYDGDDNEVEEDDYYQLYELEDFYFEPSEDGTFEVELDVYDSSRMNTSNFVGTVMLYIVVGEGSDSDVVVTLDDGKAYTFDEDTDKDDDSAYDMIVDYLDDATSKTVSYIRFGAVSSGSTVGALYPTASSTAKVTTSTKFYLSTLSLSNYSLEDVTFKPAKAGTFEIPFTAYTSANAVAATGTLTIKVPGGSGSSVEEVGDVIVYLDSDADDYYFDDDDEEGNTAYDLIIDYVYDEFDIDLEDDDAYIMFYDVENDEAGTLYANDDEDDLDDEEEYYDTDIDEFYFVVDGDGSYEAEFDVYLWDDDDDEYLYEDSFVLQIIVGDGTAVSTAKSFTSYSNGYTFKTSDFYSTLDTSSVVSVVFDKPSSGRLYVNYANGSGTAVTTNTKFYTTLSSYGTYPISSLTYIPKAGFSGNATITYVATTLAGKTVTGTITMSVKTKTASSKFSDVTASNVGTWAADSVDFASSWGLVNGTTTTAPYKFSPNANMKRCDLLLILYRAAGSPSVTGTITHSDVPSSAYYYKAAVWAYKNGIVSNIVTSAYTFAPNTAVTREEFATILYNYTKYTGVSVTNSGSLANYTDVSSVSSYAKDAMTWAVSKGYITSMSTTSLVLSPKTQATRAQIATLLHRYLTY